ncbi:alpha/beta hydrolase [Chroococcus sp. FPU101]|uniref:alpha/beta hydrolase n=1 Tax=Chroococcus sp. FPU101 TaxID=1974212 RepID=UPI001A8F1F45|nr:alpha/beta hydrolase [Chroococcus sp. FPU101]GFE70514.1 hypothetical protein CFPU101_31240 [Chroococcus sp. FPU101]
MLKTLAFSFCSAFLTALPVVAAENIFLLYGPLDEPVKVDSLETFAREGKINADLKLFLARASSEQQEKFREVLLKPIEVSPVMLSRFFNSAMGEDVLTRMGRAITIPGGENGKYALRAAIVQAAFEPEGLTLLNVLRKFPTDIELQGKYLIGLKRTIDRIIEATDYFTKEMAQLSAKEAQSNTVDFQQLPNLRQKGTYKFRKETVTLTDTSRGRTLSVLFYIPQTWRTPKTPVVILSHGLGASPEYFEDVAEHLASYGFVAAIPQHTGSDAPRKQAFLDGYAKEVFDVNEFIDRPKDISFLIDELERRNQSEFGGRLDTENVGVAGHSFGGYTALAVAGAEIAWDYLKSECDLPYSGLNVSLFLQCRALSLPRQTYSFRDPRVNAVLLKNPVESTIFGQKGLAKIQIPLMVVGGNFDPATPFVLEQVRTFTWLTTPNKYLGLAEGQAHINISELDAGVTQGLQAIPKLAFADPNLLASYRHPISIAFFEVYTANNAQFRPYLSSAYGEYLSQNQPFKFYIIDSAAEPALSQAIQDFQNK